MPSFYDTERAEKAGRLWPGIDLDELVPRSQAYAEVYAKLASWSVEQVKLTSGDARTRLLNTHRLPDIAAEAGIRAAAAIATEFYERLGITARSYLDALPAPPAQPARVVVDVHLPADTPA